MTVCRAASRSVGDGEAIDADIATLKIARSSRSDFLFSS